MTKQETPLDAKLGHCLLDVYAEGQRARDTGAVSPYGGQSLEHCLHAAGWVSRDLALALAAATNGQYRAPALRFPCTAQELADEPIMDAASGQQKAEPAWKQDGDKPRMDLIAPEFLFGTAEVLRFGAAKYAERNWEKGMSWGRVFGALMRHLWKWWGGEAKDQETGFSHLHHAACCLMFLVAYEERSAGTDDRKIPVDNP